MLNFLFSSPADSLALRALLAFLTALVIGLACGPALIRELKKLHFGQAVRTDGPKTHLAKDGTPTMGGALILAAITLSTLCWADLGNRFIWVVLFVTLGYGAIGWIDDYRKIVHHDPHGMSAREKFSWQSVIGLAAAFYLALALAVEPGGTFAEAIGAWDDARFPLDVTAKIHLYLPLWTDWAFPLADRLHCLRLHRDRRIEQCGEPHRWVGWPGHSAHGAGRLCARALCLCGG